MPGRVPLYNDAPSRARRVPNGNAGLWYDKFGSLWKADWSGFESETAKLDWIKHIANVGNPASPQRVGEQGQIEEHARRTEELVKSRGGRSFRLTTVWRFVSGMGRAHPVGNGFAWHHTLGIPYLAGSGLKGLARTYARDWHHADGIERIFGPATARTAGAGSVIFLDAPPIEPVALDADVMTPHYADWYQDRKTPGDWQSPKPIPFLTVAPGQVFLFALLPRGNAQQDVLDCGTAAAFLREALDVLGAGAKTAVGYGQFSEPQPRPEARQRAVPHSNVNATSWLGRTVFVYDEPARVLRERGDNLVVRFESDGKEEEVPRREARLK